MSKKTHVVVVTGLSGAGKSTALAALEDLGYHAIENLPPVLIVQAIEACEQAGLGAVALGFGASVGGFVERDAEVLRSLATAEGRKLTVLFLDASDDVVLRRFSETRRPHPLSRAAKSWDSTDDARSAVLEGIGLERERLTPLRAMATMVVDTSSLRVHDLRKRVLSLLDAEGGGSLRMSTRLLSFGFKYGLPNDADLVFDVRFLDNPYFVEELRPLTGEDPRVSSYVLTRDGAAELLDRASSLLSFLLPRYEAEGKSYLTVAIGCTGGQHRSVAIALALGERLRAGGARAINVVHRDAHTLSSTPAPGQVAALGARR